MNANVRHALLKSRCTPAAREYLQEFADNELFPELLTRLEQIDGQIFRLHVEAAVLEVLLKRPSDGT
jgi:hypothetical protein